MENRDPTLKTSIDKLFYPRGVAVIGSASEGKLGYELIRQMLDGGYRDVFVVNPKARGALSVPGYDAISKIDHPVDLAVIVSPPATAFGFFKILNYPVERFCQAVFHKDLSFILDHIPGKPEKTFAFLCMPYAREIRVINPLHNRR
jgi:hypothetical protein